MGKTNLVASVVSALILSAAIGWFSWWRADFAGGKAKVGLSWVELCAKGACFEADFDKIHEDSSSSVPWRIRITRWLGWLTVGLVLLAGFVGSRELAGAFVTAATATISIGAWAVFGDTFDEGSDMMKMSWGWPVFITGTIVGLGGLRGNGSA